MGHAELLGQRLAPGVDVDPDDLVGAGEPRALDHVEADAAEPEHHHVGAGFDLRRVDDRADAGGDAAADVADLVEGRVLADLGHGDFRQHRVVGEGRAAHVVVDAVAIDGEAAGAVGHHALALRGADRRAQVGLPRCAGFALAAFGRVERNDVIALLDRLHAWADIDHHAGAFVAEDHGKQPFGVGAGTGEFVRMADAGGRASRPAPRRPSAPRAARSRSPAACPLPRRLRP